MWNAVPFTHRHAQWSLYAKTNFRWRPQILRSPIWTSSWPASPRVGPGYRQGLCWLNPEQVLYFDTDSIIFSHRPSKPIPPLRDYLGEFTSELKPGDQDPIIIGTESKTVQSVARYAVLPCRQEQLNFDLLKQNFIDKVTKPTEQLSETQVYNPHKIKQETNTKTLKTIKETKR